MATTADDWRGAPGTERGARLAVAFGVSIVCHLALLVALRGLRLDAHPMPPLVVTMLASGGAGEDDAARAAGGAAPAPAAVEPAPPPVPPAAAAPVAPPAKVRRPARAQTPPRRAVADAPAPAAPVDAPAVASTAPAAAGAAAGATSEPAGAAATGPGGGDAAIANAGGRGAGSGAGAGGGADGLRAFCARCPAPEYPSRARRQGWQGTVDVELAIASDGGVREARVGRSSGYPALDDVALDVARRSRFAVPEGGNEMRGQLRYRFVLDATASGR